MLLHGLLSTQNHTAEQDAEGPRITHAPSARILITSSRSHLEHIVLSNSAAGVDVFVHSWNHGYGRFIDQQYGAHLQGSAHEPLQTRLKLESQAMSLGRAAALMRAHEARRKMNYTLAIGMRTDLVIGEPLHLDGMDPAQIWLPESCQLRSPLGQEQKGAVSAACKGTWDENAQRKHDSRGKWWIHGKPSVFSQPGFRHKRHGPQYSPEADLAFYTEDLWLAAAPAILEAWGSIAHEQKRFAADDNKRYEQMTVRDRMRQRHLSPWMMFWSHYGWPVYIHDFLNASDRVRFKRLPAAIGRYAYPYLRELATPFSCDGDWTRCDMAMPEGGTLGHCDTVQVRSVDGRASLVSSRVERLAMEAEGAGAPETWRQQVLDVVDGWTSDEDRVNAVLTSKYWRWALQCPLGRQSSRPHVCCREKRGCTCFGDYTRDTLGARWKRCPSAPVPVCTADERAALKRTVSFAAVAAATAPPSDAAPKDVDMMWSALVQKRI